MVLPAWHTMFEVDLVGAMTVILVTTVVPPAVALTSADPLELLDGFRLELPPAVTENIAELVPAGMVIELGTVKLVFELPSTTGSPPVGAAPTNFTMQFVLVPIVKLLTEQASEEAGAKPTVVPKVLENFVLDAVSVTY